LNHEVPMLGLGCGWRPELALALDRRMDLGFVEITAENWDPRNLPVPLRTLAQRNVRVVVHGIGLNLGGADQPDPARLDHLCRLAEASNAPLISEHVAFVRAGDYEAGHLTPVPRTRQMLDILCENVARARQALPVPLALENISAFFEWPDAEMSEGEFLSSLLSATDSLLLLDTANVHANAHNLGLDIPAFLDSLPLERLAYCHVGGGIERDGLWHDTHAHPVAPEALDILATLLRRHRVPGAMLERDDGFPTDMEIHRELDALAFLLRSS
jgi:uncharacterized protein (UPF0276 family)